MEDCILHRNLVLHGEYEILVSRHIAVVKILGGNPSVCLLDLLGVCDCQRIIQGTDLHHDCHLPALVEILERINRGSEPAVFGLERISKEVRTGELDWGHGFPAYTFPNQLTDMGKFWQPVANGPIHIVYGGLAAKIMKN